MSNQSYSREQVEQMIAEKLAEQKARLESLGGVKATKFVVKNGEFESATGTKAYVGVEVQGNFRPRYLSLAVAKAILADPQGFKACVESISAKA